MKNYIIMLLISLILWATITTITLVTLTLWILSNQNSNTVEKLSGKQMYELELQQIQQ